MGTEGQFCPVCGERKFKCTCQKSCVTRTLAVDVAKKETCAASCYELEPGVWIHRPWDGCTTPMPTSVVHHELAPCQHCGGTKLCDCIACSGRCSSCAWNALLETQKQKELDRIGPKGSQRFRDLIEKIRRGLPI